MDNHDIKIYFFFSQKILQIWNIYWMEIVTIIVTFWNNLFNVFESLMVWWPFLLIALDFSEVNEWNVSENRSLSVLNSLWSLQLLVFSYYPRWHKSISFSKRRWKRETTPASKKKVQGIRMHNIVKWNTFTLKKKKEKSNCVKFQSR